MTHTLAFSSEEFHQLARVVTYEVPYRNPNSELDAIRLLSNRLHLLAGRPHRHPSFSDSETRLLEHVLETQYKSKKKKRSPLSKTELANWLDRLATLVPDPFREPRDVEEPPTPTYRIPFDIVELSQFSRIFGQQRARSAFPAKTKNRTLRIQQTMSALLNQDALTHGGFRLPLRDIELLRDLLDAMRFDDPLTYDRFADLLDTTLENIHDTITPEVFA